MPEHAGTQIMPWFQYAEIPNNIYWHIYLERGCVIIFSNILNAYSKNITIRKSKYQFKHILKNMKYSLVKIFL